MRNYFQAPWSLKDLLIILTASIALTIGTHLAISYFGFSPESLTKQQSINILLGLATQWIIIMTPLLFLTAKKFKITWGSFGFKKTPLLKSIKLAAKGYLLFLAIGLVISIFMIYTEIRIPGYQIQERVLPLFGSEPLSMIIAGIAIIIIAPIVEEIFFRGFILRTLANHMKPIYGSIITALLFAILHFQFSSIIPIFILALIINSLVLKTKSIWTSIIFHSFNNALAFIVEVLIITNKIPFENVI